MKRLLFFFLLAFSVAAASTVDTPTFRTWAPTPPMGWNSWDCFGTTLTEAEAKAQADFMAAKLKSHGWQYLVVDIQWYEPGAKSHDYRKDAPLTMDGFGRLQPAPNRFPSAADGTGFTSLAAYVHSLGLKYGLHLMRGIPRQAVEKNLPIKGTKFHAQDIADRGDTCRWNPDMFGVDLSKPGAQDYYNSVFDLFASWGVDYVKVDDIASPYRRPEVEAIRRAIDRTGRPMVLSLSPGETDFAAADLVPAQANLWRISDDFWDRWLALRDQFPRLERWNPHRSPGAWPDADMLPLGTIDLGQRTTRFTPDEQQTMMTLWSIARSPLMHGGDMTKTDEATLALLTNDEVLAVNQHSANNRPLFNHDDLVAWIADDPNSSDKFLAVFNTRDRIRLTSDNARYTSAVVTRDPATAASIDADLTGGTKFFLVIDPTADGVVGDNALWRAPRLQFADGTERPLTDFKWTTTDAIWDSTSVRKNAAGQSVGIAAQAPAVTEYAVPAGAVRLKATGVLEEKADPREGGTVRFLVVVGTPENESKAMAIPVAVKLSELGFAGSVRIRDLWTHRDLGEVSGEFAPAVPFHGSGLYRLSPR
jgi:alpha-galactosidase